MSLFEKYEFDAVIHLAAESHVDRSITDPLAFVKTNVMGTCTLAECLQKTMGRKWIRETILSCFNR